MKNTKCDHEYMGANSAENDDAADWLGEFSEKPSIVALNDAFDDVLGSDTNDYLEITECAVAVVANAVVVERYNSQGRAHIIEPEDFGKLQLLEKKLTHSARKSLIKRAITWCWAILPQKSSVLANNAGMIP